MNISYLDDKQKKDVSRRILKKQGEYFTLKYVDVEELLDEASGETVDVAVDIERTYYVGRMNPDQTGAVIAILATIFANGSRTKEEEERKDNIAFLEYLDGYNLTMLVSLVLGESRAWVEENWDTDWVFQVMGIFFRYNNFFALLRSLMTMVKDMGVTEEAARSAALGV